MSQTAKKKLEKKLGQFEHGEKGIWKEIRKLEDKYEQMVAKLEKKVPKLKLDFFLFSVSNYGSYKLDLVIKYKFK